MKGETLREKNCIINFFSLFLLMKISAYIIQFLQFTTECNDVNVQQDTSQHFFNRNY